jgi:hypothetical protein
MADQRITQPRRVRCACGRRTYPATLKKYGSCSRCMVREQRKASIAARTCPQCKGLSTAAGLARHGVCGMCRPRVRDEPVRDRYLNHVEGKHTAESQAVIDRHLAELKADRELDWSRCPLAKFAALPARRRAAIFALVDAARIKAIPARYVNKTDVLKRKCADLAKAREVYKAQRRARRGQTPLPQAPRRRA